MSFATQNRRDVYLGKRACKTCPHIEVCLYVHGAVNGGCGPGLPKWGGEGPIADARDCPADCGWFSCTKPSYYEYCPHRPAPPNAETPRVPVCSDASQATELFRFDEVNPYADTLAALRQDVEEHCATATDLEELAEKVERLDDRLTDETLRMVAVKTWRNDADKRNKRIDALERAQEREARAVRLIARALFRHGHEVIDEAAVNTSLEPDLFVELRRIAEEGKR